MLLLPMLISLRVCPSPLLTLTSERSKIRVIEAGGTLPGGANPFLLSEAEEKTVEKKQENSRGELRVPRRPQWTRSMTRLQLEKQERESFLDWRRNLARLAEDSTLLLTPFERNVELWRQLWRVLERSHLVVQIVDARNPLGFRSEDLETYVREVGSDPTDEEITVPGKGKRKSLLLINKSDLLTIEQRRMWADYFEKHGIQYVFFSAANAAALQEQEDRQARRAAGEEMPPKAEDKVNDREDGDEEEEDEEEDEDEDEDPAIEKHQEEETETAPEAQVEEDDNDSDYETEDETDSVTDQLQRTTISEPSEPEDPRTRVLTVTELEDLFIRSAPDLKDFATERDPNPTKLMVGLVGYPNVGKSSTINALLGAKKVSVSATPGKTKHFQTLNYSDDVTLCDCPGLVFPQFANTQADMICDGVLPIDQMREYSAPVDLLCRRIPRAILEGTYGIRIDVKEIEDGGTGVVGWEDFLSAYAIARGMTRSSFGMPDTSRASRYVLKDYVNAKLLYARAPPGIDADEYMLTSRERTLADLEAQFAAGRKRAPEQHVSKKADTYVAPASAKNAAALEENDEEEEQQPEAPSGPRERQATSASVARNSAAAPMRTGKVKAAAFDNSFFTETGPAPRPVVKGRSQGAADASEGGNAGYTRSTYAPHQRRLGPDGMPLLDQPAVRVRNNGKKHFKKSEGKQRSGRGYD